MQRKMLVAKKERMERLISSIDDILKGDNKMDFAVFSKTEIEEMFQTMFDNMPDNMRELAVKEFGSSWRMEKTLYGSGFFRRNAESTQRLLSGMAGKITSCLSQIIPSVQKLQKATISE